MNLPTWYSTGTVSVESGGTTVTGTGSLWGTGGVDDNIMIGDLFSVPSQPLVPAVVISGVTEDSELELMWPWPGADVVAQPYIIRYVGIIERSTRANRMALERLGEVSAYFDVQVDDTDARLALETLDQPLRAGYRVLVSNIGDGSAAIYSKATAAYGNWTDPAPYSGPVGPPGPAPNLSAGTVETVPNGTPATASIGGTNPNYLLNLGLPEGPEGPLGPRGDRGINWRGVWSASDDYEEADVVTDDDISGDPAAWISLTDNLNSRPRDNPSDWAYFPGSFPTTQDYGLITEAATDYDDYGVI